MKILQFLFIFLFFSTTPCFSQFFEENKTIKLVGSSNFTPHLLMGVENYWLDLNEVIDDNDEMIVKSKGKITVFNKKTDYFSHVFYFDDYSYSKTNMIYDKETSEIIFISEDRLLFLNKNSEKRRSLKMNGKVKLSAIFNSILYTIDEYGYLSKFDIKNLKLLSEKRISVGKVAAYGLTEKMIYFIENSNLLSYNVDNELVEKLSAIDENVDNCSIAVNDDLSKLLFPSAQSFNVFDLKTKKNVKIADYTASYTKLYFFLKEDDFFTASEQKNFYKLDKPSGEYRKEWVTPLNKNMSSNIRNIQKINNETIRFFLESKTIEEINLNDGTLNSNLYNPKVSKMLSFSFSENGESIIGNIGGPFYRNDIDNLHFISLKGNKTIAKFHLNRNNVDVFNFDNNFIKYAIDYTSEFAIPILYNLIDANTGQILKTIHPEKLNWYQFNQKSSSYFHNNQNTNTGQFEDFISDKTSKSLITENRNIGYYPTGNPDYSFFYKDIEYNTIQMW